MSNAPKKQDGNTTAVFSIDLGEEDGAAMPGVTQLINPQMLAKRAEAMAKQKAPEPTTAPVSVQAQPSADEISISLEDEPAPAKVEATTAKEFTRTVASSTPVSELSLAEMGVKFELQFENERGYYRFARFKPHAGAPEPWQEKFFSQMKLDLKSILLTSEFQEYESGRHPFHQDVFGLTDGECAQVLRENSSAKTIHVLISSQSLFAVKGKVIEKFFSSEKKEATGKIEIEF